MRYTLIPLMILLVSSQFYSKSKYYIYFKDKEIFQSGVLSKTSQAYLAAEKELAPEAIERRKQVMGDNYITFEDLPITQNYIQQVEAQGIKIENKLKWFNAITAYMNDAEVKQISSFPFVSKLEKVRITKVIAPIETQSFPAVKSLRKTEWTTSLNYGPSLTQNYLSDIPAVHDLGIKGTNVYIGILDDGFSYKTYNSLKNLKVVKEYNYVTKVNTVSNQSGHGSSVFCLMAGYDPGNAIGPAYDAKFFLAETEIDATETHVEEDNYAAALQDMETAGVDITSSSLGYNIFDNGQTSYTYADMNGKTTIVAKAINLAFSRGVFSLTAAGNDGSFWGEGLGGLSSPGDAYNVITVGAVDAIGTIASFSSRGPTSDGRIKPEVVAMGQNNYVALTNGTSYGTGSGTSYATPIAAGIAGLLKSCWPHLTNVQMRTTFIECGSHPKSPDNSTGYGLISATRVIAYPNLQLVVTQYTLNKLFINSAGVNSSTVKLNYKVGTGSFQNVAMNYDGSLKYNFALPISNSGTPIEFYFEYANTSGNLVREPSTTNYKFNYGSLVLNNIVTDVISNTVIPTGFSLSQNYPNPFNPSTVISYQIPVSSHVTLKVFDILGNEIATLVDELKSAGSYNSTFSIQNLSAGRQGYQLPSGVYFYRLTAGAFTAIKKFVLMK